MKPDDKVKDMIQHDPDYIASKRFDNSVSKIMERYPEGCPDRIIASVLMMTEEELEDRFTMIVKRLRREMKAKVSL
jgi:hypothetical protein